MWNVFLDYLYVDYLVLFEQLLVPVRAWRVDTPWYAITVLCAGAFERPSFGNGEVPLWSVAVCVSGRFNNSCHRNNFHSGENQD